MRVSLRSPRFTWLWMLPLLLLSAALAVSLLEGSIFDEDEAATSLNAGARHLGPYSLAEVLQGIAANDPAIPGPGLELVVSVWGRLAGWSEVALRALSWFAGLMTLAWLWRCGMQLCDARVALTAVLLSGTSGLFLFFMHNHRHYAPALLLVTMVLWAYWRCALEERKPGRGAGIVLVAVSFGLLLTNYICAMLLPALTLFHLLYVRKDRRWWRVVVLFGLAGLLWLPFLPLLLGGIADNDANVALQMSALDSAKVILLFLRHFSNQWLQPWPQVGTLVGLALPLPLLIAGWRSRRGQAPGPTWFLALTVSLLALLLLGANERMQVLTSSRVRYLAALWPAGALLLAGLGWRLPRSGLLTLALLVTLAGLHGHVNVSLRPGDHWRRSPDVLAAARAVAAQDDGETLLVGRVETLGHWRPWELYTGGYGERRLALRDDASVAALESQLQGYGRVLLFYDPDDRTPGALAERLRLQGWFRCHSAAWGERLRLERFHAPWPAGAAIQERLQFEEVATLLVAEEARPHKGLLRLRVQLQGIGGGILAPWSLAVHVIDPRTGERVALGDTGVGHDAVANLPDAVVPLCSEVDVSALTAGEYELRVGLYNWQTGELRPGRDVESGASGDMHMLQRFRVG